MHETTIFLDSDCIRYIVKHLQHYNFEYETNKYMIHEVIKILDKKYKIKFTNLYDDKLYSVFNF